MANLLEQIDFACPDYDPRLAAMQIVSAIAPELPQAPIHSRPDIASKEELIVFVELMLIYKEISSLDTQASQLYIST